MRQQRTDTAGRSAPSGLSRRLIIETAIALAQREGEAALSMRRIAQELDVWPMSLYRYFQDKQALLDALAEAAAEQIALPEVTADWQAQIRQLLERARTAFAQHPGGGHLRLSGPALLPAAEQVTKAGIDILSEAGLEPADAELAWQVLVDYVAGSAASNDQQFEYGMQVLIDGLQAKQPCRTRDEADPDATPCP